MHDEQLSEAITRPNSRTNENPETISGDGKVNWQKAYRDIEETVIHKSQVGISVVDTEIVTKLTKFKYKAIVE